MNDRKRVLFIHHGGSKGGAPRSLSFLVKKIDHTMYDPYVLSGIDKDGNNALFQSMGAKYIYKKGVGPWHGSTVAKVSLNTLFWNPVFALFTMFQLPKVLREITPDLVHLNSTCLWVAAKVVKKYDARIPVVCHVREPLLSGFWGNIIRKNCEKYVDHFVAIEQLDANTLNTTKPVTIINNFVDFDLYNESVKSDCLYKELSLQSDTHILLYLARIDVVNGALEMLQALRNLLDKRKDIHLCIVGAVESDEPYQKKVIEIASKIDNAHVLSFREDIPQVIASSDVMLVPFQQPHFARSIIEAGALGVPSIGSNIGGLDELIIDGETGYLFDYKTFDGFDKLCEKLIDDSTLRETLGRNAIRLAHERFDAVKNAKRTFAIYDRYLRETTSK